MKFAASEWLWALLGLPLLYALMLWGVKRRKRRFERFARQEMWNAIVPELDWSARLRKGRVMLLALAFVLLALARPQWGSHEETVRVSGLDLMLVLDISNSMEVEDVTPSRLKKAKHAIRTLVGRLGGDRVGIVAFAASSYVACPLTTDLDYVMESLDILTPNMVLNQGTDIGVGLETALNALERGAEELKATENQEKNSSRAVVLISDGEDHQNQAVETAKKLKEKGIKLYVLGVGTQKGGPVPIRDDAGQLHGYKKDRKGNAVVSTFSPDALMAVATSAGGRYWNVTVDESEVDEILEDTGALSRSDYAERRFVVYEERFQFPLAVAVLLFLVEFSLAAHAAKPRVLVMLLLWLPGVLVPGLAFTASAKAAPVESYLENEKGLKAYQEGKMEEAKKHFGAAQARDPDLPELRFNQGAVQAQNNDLDGAIQGFEGAAKGAIQRGDDDLASKALFNLGAVLEKKGDLKGAVRSYLESIEQAKSAKDKSVEEDARKNIELLYKKQQQQKQQQSQRQEKGEGQSGESQQSQAKEDQEEQGKDKQKQNKKGEGQDSEEKEQADSSPPRYEDPSKGQGKGRRKEFKSQKLSKEDAERVMSELSSREKELQAKLGKRRGQPRTQEKDW